LYQIDIGIGDPVSAIAARAQAHNVDLVVTGRHRWRVIAGMFNAATTDRLMRQVQQPILLVSNSNQSPYRRVLIPVDFSDPSAARIQFAAAFLPQARLHVLHAYQRPFHDDVVPFSSMFNQEERGKFSGLVDQQPKPALCRWIESLGLGERSPLVTIENGDALAVTKKELARQKTDLLIVGGHAQSGMKRTPAASKVGAILRSSPCDTLVLPLHGPS
jgi:nucleotide-binding universal stress UspA family protein